MTKLERFNKFWKVEHDCWTWIGALRGIRDPYGVFYWDASHPLVAAHRAAYMLHVGEIPGGYLVCHHCDHKRCVNPKHLFLGTQSDNTQDALRKGLLYQGTKCHRNILTELQVREIRALLANGEKPAIIAPAFGVVRGAVYNIKNGVTWRWLS